MTHEEEYESFLGSEELDPAALCRHCHDYPCACTVDDLMLHDDWDAEIDAQRIRNSESAGLRAVLERASRPGSEPGSRIEGLMLP
jgi:hypothetical protein